MARRLLARMLVFAAPLPLIGAVAVPPAFASPPASWQIAAVIGTPLESAALTGIAASSPDNAWAVGNTSCRICAPTTMVQHWDGQSWQPFALSAALAAADGQTTIGTSSPNNTWIFAVDESGTFYAVHVADTGVTQSVLPGVGSVFITSTAVFGASDAWAFGSIFDPVAGVISGYAAHFDGQAWTQVPVPVINPSVSAVRSDSLWIVGPTSLASPGPAYAAAMWTGNDWRTVALPDATALNLPAGLALAPVGILGLNTNQTWVTADTVIPGAGIPGGSTFLLHWNGNKWISTSAPSSIDSFDNDMASDGRGGFWVSGFDASFVQHLYHFLNDTWTSQLVPTENNDQQFVGGLAWVPGTTSLFGVGSLFGTAGGTQAVVFSSG